jgi:hypothetical protein
MTHRFTWNTGMASCKSADSRRGWPSVSRGTPVGGIARQSASGLAPAVEFLRRVPRGTRGYDQRHTRGEKERNPLGLLLGALGTPGARTYQYISP